MFFVKVKVKFPRPTKAIICFSTIFLLLSLPLKAETDLILAEIGEHKISLQDLENKISMIKKKNQDESFDPDKEVLLLEMVNIEVFAKEAVALGLERDKEVQKRIEKLKNDMLIAKEKLQGVDKESQTPIRVARNYVLATEYLHKEIEENINIDENEILRYYEKNRSELMEPEKIRARQIYIAVNTETETKTKIDAAKKKAESILERLKNGEDFGTLASEFSQDSLTKDKGGDLGYFAKGRLVPELEKPVFHLKQGQVSPVLKTKGGFHIFKLEDRTKSRPLEYNEARGRIMETLKAEKPHEILKALEEKLYKKYEVKIYKDRIPSTPLSLAP